MSHQQTSNVLGERPQPEESESEACDDDDEDEEELLEEVQPLEKGAAIEKMRALAQEIYNSTPRISECISLLSRV